MVNNRSVDIDTNKIKVTITEKSFPLVILNRLSQEDISKYIQRDERSILSNKSKVFKLGFSIE